MAEPGQTEVGPGEAPLACAVLSLRNEPGLVAAVRSLLAQDPKPEVVVVNSGGGRAREALSRAGLDVPLIDFERRLLPGAARNIGTNSTRAPIVAFLAADCLAQPSWVARRVDAHGDGAAAVASALVPAKPATRSAWASHMLLYHRRLCATPPTRRVLNPSSFDRSVLRRYGPFREDLELGEDTEYLERLGAERVVWSEGVLTEHRSPPTVRALVADQFKRGRARAAVESRLGGQKSRFELARGAVVNVAPAVRAAEAIRPQGTAPTLLVDGPLLALGGLACAAGALSAGIAPGRGRLRAASR